MYTYINLPLKVSKMQFTVTFVYFSITRCIYMGEPPMPPAWSSQAQTLSPCIYSQGSNSLPKGSLRLTTVINKGQNKVFSYENYYKYKKQFPSLYKREHIKICMYIPFILQIIHRIKYMLTTFTTFTEYTDNLYKVYKYMICQQEQNKN